MLRLTFVTACHAIWHSTGEEYDKEAIKSILGYLEYNGTRTVPKKLFSKREESLTVPDAYDVHHAHPHCAVEVNDQSTCGSCWAVSSAETMTDRLCLAGKETIRISAADLLECCGDICGYGCDGGWPSEAWWYFSGTGVVDGGPYGDTKHCTSYPFAPCSHHVKDPKLPDCGPSQETPRCKAKCINDETWDAAKIKNPNQHQPVYHVRGEKDMMRDLFANGPITVAFTVYEDFPTYKSGVYEADQTKENLGGHAVELVGYGTDDEEERILGGKKGGIPFWRIKNSWNRSWGEGGYFRIIRGRNECGIEERGVAGLVTEGASEEEIIA